MIVNFLKMYPEDQKTQEELMQKELELETFKQEFSKQLKEYLESLGIGIDAFNIKFSTKNAETAKSTSEVFSTKREVLEKTLKVLERAVNFGGTMGMNEYGEPVSVMPMDTDKGDITVEGLLDRIFN